MFDFISIGDWGFQSPMRKEIAHQVRTRYTPSFLTFLGDNFYPNGVAGVHDPQWKLYEDDFGGIPAYAVVGNHDYLQNVDAQMAYQLFSDSWKMPSLYYDIVREHCHLIFLDTVSLASATTSRLTGLPIEPLEPTRQSQLRWLHETLRDSIVPIKIVLGHYPILSGGEHGDCNELIRDILPMLRQYKVTMYISGHDHCLQLIERFGIHFIISGSGSHSRPCASTEGTLFQTSAHGFVRVIITDHQITVIFISSTGATLHQNVLQENIKK